MSATYGIAYLEAGDRFVRKMRLTYEVLPVGQDIVITWSALLPRGYGYDEQAYDETPYGGITPPDFLGYEVSVYFVLDQGDVLVRTVQTAEDRFVYEERQNVYDAARYGLGFQTAVKFSVRPITTSGQGSSAEITTVQGSGTLLSVPEPKFPRTERRPHVFNNQNPDEASVMVRAAAGQIEPIFVVEGELGQDYLRVDADGEVNVLVPLDMNTRQIFNLADPVANQDAATKAYVDNENFNQTVAIQTVLASTVLNFGASLIGVHDAAGIITAQNVEAALAEIVGRLNALNKVFSWQASLLGGVVRDPNTGTLAAANPSIAGTGSAAFYAYAGNWADAQASNRWAFQFDTPSELDVTQAITAKVVFLVSTTGTGTVEIGLDARMVADGEHLTTGGSAPGAVLATKVATSYGTNTMLEVSIPNVLAGIAAGDHVKGCITRDSTGGNDDYTGVIRPIGLIFTGKRL